MSQRFQVGICQIKVVDDKALNLASAGRMVEEAARKGCRLAVLPEMFNCPYSNHHFPHYAENIPAGQTAAMLADLAAQHRIYLVGGSIPERDQQGRIFNTSLVFDPSGMLIAKHRKLHLFDIDIPDRIVFKESNTLSPGNKVTTFPTDFGLMGLGICYDLRFPELTRLMTMQGATTIIYPAAFNTVTGPDHWQLLLRSRALDNQVYVIGAGPAYNGEATYHAYGHSMAADPWGRVIAETGSEEALLSFEIDLDVITRIREELPLLKHRRPELYK
ncbi:MAG: carbon-nitrogen hydrolase family protein [Syntrophomonadaceae bacterium]|nr:carbon-nitrogen hydrolase family protein [Syntrophomonadaceae bacterium]